MPECYGDGFCEKRRDESKGVSHYEIITHVQSIDHIEIWGEKVQEVENLSDLFGERVFIRTFMKNTLPKRFIDLFKKETELVQETETGTIKLIGYNGSTPILEIGKRKVYAYLVKKTTEWTGHNYPPFKKAPQ